MQPYDWFDVSVADLAVVLLTLVIAICAVLTVVRYWRRDHVRVLYRDVPLPGIGPFDGPGATCTCEHACTKHGVQLESAIVGSNFTTVPRSKIPKVQAAVYSVARDGKLSRYLGVATRIGDWLVVPQHVIAAEEVVSLLSMATDPALSYKIETINFEPIEGDLSAMKLSEEGFSKLGMVKASMASMDGSTMASVTSSSKDPEVSFGTLTHDTKIFGGMIFQGSTKGGFSGAPYMVGKQIAGIHLGGGVVNYGLNATYIFALLQKPEETAEWLLKLRKKNGPLRYSRSKFDPSEAQVFVYGRYHTVDIALLEGDIEEPAGEIYMPNREVEVEVNVAQSFPPQYLNVAGPLVDTLVEATNDLMLMKATMVPKNSLTAELSSADAEAYIVRLMGHMEKIDEKTALLQGLQNSVSDRYREVQMILAKLPKGSESREEVVKENEKLKEELREIKQFKTSANVETSLLRAIPKPVQQARAKKEARRELVTKMQMTPNDLESTIQALVEAGIVSRVAGPVGNAEITTASTSGSQSISETKPSILTGLSN